MKKFASLLLTVALGLNALAADPNKTTTSKNSVKTYIRQWAKVAQENMSNFGIPASIILAQGILESGYGNSSMARKANNHFGIKCLGWEGEEYYQSGSTRSCFRKYTSSRDSFKDHARILSTKDRYRFLFRYDIRDYRAWARGLKKAGYASNGQYDRLLIKTIEQYQLYKFDQEIAGNGKVRLTPPDPVRKPQEVPVAMPLEPAPIAIEMQPIVADGSAELLIPASDAVDLEIRLPENFVPEARIASGVALRHHVVQPGDQWLTIAEKYGLTVAELLAFNELDHFSVLTMGEPIYLEPKSESCRYATHTMRPGQTIWEVSQYYGVTEKYLRKINRLPKNRELNSGSELWLKPYH